jgi:hypothetical protein
MKTFVVAESIELSNLNVFIRDFLKVIEFFEGLIICSPPTATAIQRKENTFE